MVAFRATLEELESADLLLPRRGLSHRASRPDPGGGAIIGDLRLDAKAALRVFNKRDLGGPSCVENLARRHGGVAIIRARHLHPSAAHPPHATP